MSNELAVQETSAGFGINNPIELKIIDAVVGKLITNSDQVLLAIREKCAEYKDVEKYTGREDIAKKERALLNRALDGMDKEAKRINALWMKPLDEFNANIKLIKTELKSASGGLDELVKNVEAVEKDSKRKEIQEYFDAKDFNLVSLDRIFNSRWLNKGFKKPDIWKEIDAKTAGIYADIKALERIPDYGATAKTLYLDTLDMAAALRQIETMKANAERLAKERAEREERERRERIEQNKKALEQEKYESVPPSERINDLVNRALEIPIPAVEQTGKPEIMEFTLKIRGAKEKLFALKAWMSENDITYEKIG
jgi:hypothetical protein